jgi:hypothetical protein
VPADYTTVVDFLHRPANILLVPLATAVAKFEVALATLETGVVGG